MAVLRASGLCDAASMLSCKRNGAAGDRAEVELSEGSLMDTAIMAGAIAAAALLTNLSYLTI
jgi:hypothetical protein